ncbi:DNA mismatch repair protein MutL [Blattabacterium sp. (Blattella germanica) str. Bge]|uniref:DNA mismatch repair endonuclease MutL n=1 Tax=Blattabacterium sp. (Blattella germanica) TaxID=624186 RepID=UPI0001BB625B|nr:DNA mismatch repair endonuclease MutL [Blattabacterium sp. (Blattella germanica)]ACY40549.1 DNA mismatch repair protein MutL [Blattabacterium sp. (Blattella germanica) str. Bge]
MKDLIQFLPINVISQIAAGEVILRPSSVLRELLENAIDANAKMIDIFIKNSGKTLIQLIDDGDGMSVNDAKMSIQRYATSKIKQADDIFKMRTKGFRGEALASIALISQLEIQTKNQENVLGIHLFVEEGKIKEEIPINMLKGTRISVKNIFYKLPARRQFLKSSQIEFQHIVHEFYKIVLAHRNILYRFYHNDKIVFYFQEASLRERIKEIFKNENKILTPIFIKKNRILVKGFVSVPDSSIKKGNQLILVNQRCVTHLFLHKKIIHAYDGFLKDLKTVSYFIFIHIDPNFVNWNIHPSKKEVQLEEEDIIGCMIQQEIKNILFDQYEVKNKELKKYDVLLSCDSKNSFLNDFSFEELSYKKKVIQLENLFRLNDSSFFNKNVDLTNQLSRYIANKKRIITLQINRKYIIFTLNNEYIIFVDQHRAHRNILFEFFLREKNLISQQFLFPIEVRLLKKEFISLKNIKDDLINFGFHLYFCNESAYLYSVPENIHQNILVEVFQNILKYNFIKGKKKNKKILIQSISKSASIKYGTELYPDKMECLIRDLFSCHNPNYTDSGDPIFFVLRKNFFKK